MGRAKQGAAVGVSDHAGWAVLVTVANGAVRDRRRVELVAPELPKLPHHHEAQKLPVPEALDLINTVAANAAQCATACLDDLAESVPEIHTVALRVCPTLPETIEERITNYRAQCVADTVMYRQALAMAAEQRGWAVHWYAPKQVFEQAGLVLRRASIDDLLDETGVALGSPWRKDHSVAMAAAIATTGGAR